MQSHICADLFLPFLSGCNAKAAYALVQQSRVMKIVRKTLSSFKKQYLTVSRRKSFFNPREMRTVVHYPNGQAVMTTHHCDQSQETSCGHGNPDVKTQMMFRDGGVFVQHCAYSSWFLYKDGDMVGTKDKFKKDTLINCIECDMLEEYLAQNLRALRKRYPERLVLCKERGRPVTIPTSVPKGPHILFQLQGDTITINIHSPDSYGSYISGKYRE